MTDFDFNSSFRDVPIFGNYTPYFPEEGDEVSAEVVVLACFYTIVFGVGLFGKAIFIYFRMKRVMF
jgi:hypothetical protein